MGRTAEGPTGTARSVHRIPVAMKTLRTFAVFLSLPLVTFAAFQTWSFDPPVDSFGEEALLDLRHLNEAEAGQLGFIGLSPDGESFLRGDGQPIRFWSVVGRIDLHPVPDWSEAEIDHHYRFLAKRGVNLARIFGQLPLLDPGKPIATINQRQLEILHRHIAAAKRHGIYLFISIYWGHEVEFQEHWGMAPEDMPYSMVFWEKPLQEAYKDWFREVFSTVNPHTGLAIREDPGVAVIQIHNEDSLLFWTFNLLTDRQRTVLGRRFADWAKQRYGSPDRAREAWGGSSLEADRWAEGVLHLVGLDQLREQAEGSREARFRDQMRFMVETQREFYDEMERFLRDEVGCQPLLNASNWKTADAAAFEDLERYTYAGMEVMAVNRFVTGPHVGEEVGWRIVPGDCYKPLSTLKDPLSLSVSVRQPAGYPFLITETTWVSNPWQAEGPFMTAVYMGLSGFDSAMFFNANSVGWQRDPQIDFMPGSMHKWHAMTPAFIGQYPAPAIAHRFGYLTEPEQAAVLQKRTMEEMLARVPAYPTEMQGFDPNRDTFGGTARGEGQSAIDPLAFLVGPVRVVLDAGVSETQTVDLDRYIDREAGIVRSMTGEIVLDYKQGICVVDTPGFQGAAAFFREAGGFANTTDCRIRSTNEYACVMAVSMDGRPLRESGEILVQVGTVVRPEGWTEEPATFSTEDESGIEGYRITSIGQAPWSPRVNQVRMELRNPGLRQAHALDANGYADGEVAIRRTGDWVAFDLPPNTLYVLLRP